MSKERISWHPAFYDAIQMELMEYERFLSYETEHQLTAEPLVIDVLVIKKDSRVTIKKSVGRIFKGHNIVEYKSPTDYVSIEDFHKVCAYTFLYMAQNQVTLDDVTMTLVETKQPKKLLAYIKDRFGTDAYSYSEGIHYIKTDFFPIQIVETKRLTDDGEAWLKSLSDSLDLEGVYRIYRNYNKFGYRNRFGAYLDVVIHANGETWKEALAVNGSGEQWLISMMDEYGLLDNIKAEGKAEGETNAYLSVAKKLHAIGMELDKISEVTSIPPEELKKHLYQ